MTRIKPIFKYDRSATQVPFAQAQCLLTISVGQEVHEKEKFAATIELVNNHFHSCILLIDDTLQRHTMVLNYAITANELMHVSRCEGDYWLERNQVHYQKLAIPYKIIRWDFWLKHPQYRDTQQLLQNHLAKDSNYQAVFTTTIDTFLQRYIQRLPLRIKVNFDLPRAHQLCHDYLLEECTALCLWPALQCHFEVYPSPRNAAMAYTHQHFVLPKHPDLLHPVAIKFKQRKQLKPQQFSALTDDIC